MASISFDTQLAPSALGYTVNSFIKAASEDPPSLTLQPPFQRNLVWNDEQRSYLIDSILRGFPVPEVYIQKRTEADGSEELVVVDGQQRISTCIEFVAGRFRTTSGDELDERWRHKWFNELDPALKARFRSFEFVARQLPDVGDVRLREVFKRLNRTVESLEPQELRHAAYTGEFIQLVEAASQSAGMSELGVFSARDALRRRHDEFMSEVFYAWVLGTPPNKKDGLDEHFMTYEHQSFPLRTRTDLIRRFGRANDFLTDCGFALKRSRFRNKSDAYSLLVYLLGAADRLPKAGSEQKQLMKALVDFSEEVNTIKRTESAGEPTDDLSATTSGRIASSYLRSVERAASDRGNRVRRQAALDEVLADVVPNFPLTSLSEADEEWLRSGDQATEDVSGEDDDLKSELEEAQRVLVEGA